MELGLKDKVALVTGGARGLGEAICRRLAAEGVKLAINYHSSADEAASLAARLESEHGTRAVQVAGDITQEDDVERLFATTENALGPIDILVNNAGICPVCLVKDMSAAMWNETIGINLTGTFLASREMVRRRLADSRPGRIVNVVSPAAFKGSVNGKSHYAASKAGVVALTVSLAREVAAHGIIVNAVAPGMMKTDMTAATLQENEDAYRRSIPLGRLASPDEMGDVVAFLASERNSYMTGATIDASGGSLMR